MVDRQDPSSVSSSFRFLLKPKSQYVLSRIQRSGIERFSLRDNAKSSPKGGDPIHVSVRYKVNFTSQDVETRKLFFLETGSNTRFMWFQ